LYILSWFIEDLILNPSEEVNADSVTNLKNFKDTLLKWCNDKYGKNKSFSLNLKTPKIKEREKKINCKTFHQAGICVPVDSK
jgi:hypothetical protein